MADACCYSISTIAALGLDIYVHRQQTRSGIYRLPDVDDNKGASRDPNAEAEPRESGAWDAPRLPMGPYGEQADSKVHQHQRGYSVPENQFDYDTGYSGHQPGRA